MVTGASSGIGEATARRLAREPGARLVLVARREERLAELARTLGCPTTWVAVDLTDDDGPQRVLEHVEAHHGSLDLLVNNAGSAWRATFAQGGWENVRRTMELNFDSVVRLSEALLPLLRSSAPSAVVNVASTAGRVARGGTGAYSASKSALIGWSDALYAEERPGGVHVGLVLPGSSPPRAFPSASSSTGGPPGGWSPPPSARPRRSSTPEWGVAPSATSRAPTSWPAPCASFCPAWCAARSAVAGRQCSPPAPEPMPPRPEPR